MSNSAADDRLPHGASLLPRGLDEREHAAAPVLPTLDALVIDDLADDEDAAFAAGRACPWGGRFQLARSGSR